MQNDVKMTNQFLGISHGDTMRVEMDIAATLPPQEAHGGGPPRLNRKKSYPFRTRPATRTWCVAR